MPDRSDYKHLYDTGHWQRRRALSCNSSRCANGVNHAAGRIVDHIEPHKGDRNKFFVGRLQRLCERCHNHDKQRVQVRGYSDDPRHPFNKVR